MGDHTSDHPEARQPTSSVQIQGRSSGPPAITVTVYADDVAEAARLAREQYDALMATYRAPTAGSDLARWARAAVGRAGQGLPVTRARTGPENPPSDASAAPLAPSP